MLDRRASNSWRENLSEVSTREFVETQVINNFAPFILITGLRASMANSPNPKRFVVNATGVDGLFVGAVNTEMHPHVNMSKAALNMLSFTSAQELVSDHIYMNSVDTGWVSDDSPYTLAQSRRARGFVVPLDLMDAAARLYDPIVSGLAGDLYYGNIFKNYQAYKFDLQAC